MMTDGLHYFGMYQNDGIAVFKGDWNTDVIDGWTENFQCTINSITGNEFLIFTAVIWDPNSNKGVSKQPRTTTVDANRFSHF